MKTAGFYCAADCVPKADNFTQHKESTGHGPVQQTAMVIVTSRAAGVNRVLGAESLE